MKILICQECKDVAIEFIDEERPKCSCGNRYYVPTHESNYLYAINFNKYEEKVLRGYTRFENLFNKDKKVYVKKVKVKSEDMLRIKTISKVENLSTMTHLNKEQSLTLANLILTEFK